MRFLPGESVAFIFNKPHGLLPPITEHNAGLSATDYLVLNHGVSVGASSKTKGFVYCGIAHWFPENYVLLLLSLTFCQAPSIA